MGGFLIGADMGEFGKPTGQGRKKGSTDTDKTLFAKAKLKGKSNVEAYVEARHGQINNKSARNLKVQADAFATRPLVRAEIERLEKAAAERMKATPDAIVAKFEEIAFDPNTKQEQVIAALDRLAKIASLYNENVNVNHKVEVSMADKKAAITEWIEGLNGETEKPAEVVSGEPGQMDNGE